MAPAPNEYAEMTLERAMWQNFGKREEDMTVLEYEQKAAMLRAESEQKKGSG